MECELCGVGIGNRPFALSSLAEPPRVLKVCESCAGSVWICQDHDNVEVEVWRDDLIVADENRLFQAVDEALYVLEEHGWTCESMRIRAKSELVKEPYE